jgi:Flp pilus assembly protein TadD
MRSREAVVCPACGTVNRPTWVFCARCGEPLEGATPTLPPAPTVVVQDAVAAEGPADNSALVLMLGVTAMAVVFATAYRYVSANPPAPGPDPGMFTVATQPAAPPRPPVPEGRGVADYDEGRRLLAAGDAAGAVSALNAAVAADPDNPRYRTMLAAAYSQTGDPERALAEQGEAARLDPGLEVQYARALDFAGRTGEAIAAYEAAAAGRPDAAVVREELGNLLYRTGAYAEAVPHLEAAVASRPTDPVLAQRLGYALESTGDKAGAIDVYRQVVAQAPAAAVIARSRLSENLYQEGKANEALSVLREGVSLRPDAPLLQRELGSLLERAGNREEAAKAYGEYARLAPNAPDAKALAEYAARLAGGGSR